MLATTFDFRYAVRSIRRTPLVSALAIVILSVSIGLVTMVFSIVNGVFLRPLPYPGSESVLLLNYIPSLRVAVDELHRTSTQLVHVATFNEKELSLVIDGDPISVIGSRIDSGFSAVLRTAPILGSIPNRQQFHDSDPWVLIGERLWKSRFGRRPDIIGATVRVDGQLRRIAGVMPSWFTFPSRSQVWIPFGSNERSPMDYVGAVGRMKSKEGLAVVRRESQLVLGRLRSADSGRYRRALDQGGLDPIEHMGLRGDRFGSTTLLWAIFAGATCVLTVASTNLAALMLARGVRRRGEMLIRTSLGASRMQLIGQQITEGLIIGASATVAGTALSFAGLKLLLATCPGVREVIPAWVYLGIDWRVMLFASLVALLAVLVFSVWPAVEAVRVEVSGALRSLTDHAVSHRHVSRRLHLPVVFQVSLSVILLVASVILARSAFEFSRGRTLFFNNLYFARLVSYRPGDTTRTPYTQFLISLGSEVRRRAGDNSIALLERYAGLHDKPPISDFDLFVADNNRPLSDPYSYPGMPVISDNYFDVVGVQLVRGRAFDLSDPPGFPTAVVVSKRFAMEVWGSVDVLGKALVLARHRVRVIGVSENVRRIGVTNGRITFEEGRDIYFSERQVLTCCHRGGFVGRSERGPAPIAQIVSSAAATLGLTTAVNVRSLADEIEGRQTDIVLAAVLGFFAATAILFAGLGIYGLVAFTVSHRLREAGLRSALGAQSRDIVREMMKGGMRLVLVGVLVGLGGAIVVGRMLDNFVISSRASSAFAAVAAALLFVAIGGLACYIPARHSGRTDPAVLLRE